MPAPGPSTAWKEKIAPDEGQRYAAHAAVFAEIQKRKSAQFGNGRALHRKQLTAAHGTLEVLDGLPSYAHNGLFSEPRVHEVWVRLSNGGMDRARDSTPDVRGFSIKVQGVEGASALGDGPAKSQDFTLINQEAFAFTGSAEFVDFVEAASHGNGNLLKYLFRRYGVFGAPRQLARMLKLAGKPFSGFATEPFFSAVPMACEPYAVRVRLLPDPSNSHWDGAVNPASRGMTVAIAKNDWNADFSARLRSQTLHWDLQVQPFVHESITPIEDASVNWPTPYTTVARLMLPQQDTESRQAQAFAQRVEAAVFDPWQALAEHRPLGDVQRARKVVYFQSQKGRGAA